ncbi:venom serine carboxypeptidase [Vespula maculifrons]|uniref:Venom serine carboxypeptidase n=1 Tax=Vespula maculifrons TaxID=7453 RepID=A0ABD2CJM1_VESMC
MRQILYNKIRQIVYNKIRQILYSKSSLTDYTEITEACCLFQKMAGRGTLRSHSISKLVDEDTVEITRASRNYAKSTSILTSIRKRVTIRFVQRSVSIDSPSLVVLCWFTPTINTGTIGEIDLGTTSLHSSSLQRVSRSIPSSRQLSGRVLSRQGIILTTLAARKYSWSISLNLIYVNNPIGTGYRNDKGYTNNETQAAFITF